jgi:hypothetical protein
LLDTEFAVPTLFKLLPLIFTISLSTLAIVLSEFLPKVLIQFKFSRLGYNIFGFFNQRFLIELFYNEYITGLVLKLGGQTTKVIDKGSVELLGPYGLEKGLITLSRNIASLDTGVITSYALYILIGLIFYIMIPYLYLTDNSLLLLILLALFSLIYDPKNLYPGLITYYVIEASIIYNKKKLWIFIIYISLYILYTVLTGSVVYAAEPDLFSDLSDAEYWKAQVDALREEMDKAGLNKPNAELSPEQIREKLEAHKILRETIAISKEHSSAPNLNTNNESLKRASDSVEESSNKKSK